MQQPRKARLRSVPVPTRCKCDRAAHRSNAVFISFFIQRSAQLFLQTRHGFLLIKGIFINHALHGRRHKAFNRHSLLHMRTHHRGGNIQPGKRRKFHPCAVACPQRFRCLRKGARNARAGNRDHPHKPEQHFRLPPGRQVLQHVLPHDQADLCIRHFRKQGAYRVHSVALPGALQLHAGSKKPFLAAKSRFRHPKARFCRHIAKKLLVGRVLCNHEQHAGKAKLLFHATRHVDMPVVDGVKAPTKQSNFQCGFSPVPSFWQTLGALRIFSIPPCKNITIWQVFLPHKAA